MRYSFLVLSLFFLPCAPRVEAAMLTVCPTCAYRQIKKAVEMAKDGDVVLVKKGVYYERNIVIDKSITIRGEGFPILDGQKGGEILTIVADKVVVEGLHIRNTGSSYVEDRAGIRLRRVGHFAIRDNKLENTAFGIYVEYGRNGLIQRNEVSGQAKDEASSGNAVHLWYCKHMLVEANRLRGHRDGIYLEFTDSSRIRQNLSERHLRYGLHFMFSNDDDYFHNTFRRNGAGVAVMFSRRVHMWDNLFEYNWGQASYGLLLKEINDAVIRRNTFRHNTIGIFVEGAARIRYSENVFSRNGWAIKMSGGCLDNTVERNNFLYNTFDLAMNSGPSGNTFDGNYWSAYDGYDLDRDGVGDVPYRPVKLFNYVVNRTPEAMVLLRSMFVDLLNFSERVSPVFTPANVADHRPLMKKISIQR
jgi:nitrous oxidase accessory protein